MSDWRLINDDPPHSTEVMLWLRAEDGSDTPIGRVLATYKHSEFFEGWHAKSLLGEINTGIRSGLVTHYMLLPEGPDAGD
jgi:hypothetical protein